MQNRWHLCWLVAGVFVFNKPELCWAKIKAWPNPYHCRKIFEDLNLRRSIQDFYLITADRIDEERFENLFAALPQASTSTYRTNPETYEKLIEELAPLIDEHPRGLLSVQSFLEAEELTSLLQSRLSKRFAVLHSSMAKEDYARTEHDFNQGVFDYIVTDRDTWQGFDFQLAIYLKRTKDPRDLFTEIGINAKGLKPPINVAALWDETRAGRLKSLSALVRWLQEKQVTSSVNYELRFHYRKSRPKDLPSSLHQHYGISWYDLLGKDKAKRSVREY